MDIKSLAKCFAILLLGLFACSASHLPTNEIEQADIEPIKKKKHDIDLSNWKLTVPIGKPLEINPPEILDYSNIEEIKPYMFDDEDRGGLAFFTVPNNSTANSKYSRSELREQMVPGSNNVNWTFDQGGSMVGKLAVDNISRDENGKYHSTIIMQIHGRLTNEQRDLVDKKDNDAPPILKIYWKEGKIRVKTKILKDPNASDTEILHKTAWGDDEGFTFEEQVDFRKFKLEVTASKGELVVALNDNEYKVYKNDHMEKWSVFENYFKAGNYLQTTDKEAFAKVVFFSLDVNH